MSWYFHWNSTMGWGIYFSFLLYKLIFILVTYYYAHENNTYPFRLCIFTKSKVELFININIGRNCVFYFYLWNFSNSKGKHLALLCFAYNKIFAHWGVITTVLSPRPKTNLISKSSHHLEPKFTYFVTLLQPAARQEVELARHVLLSRLREIRAGGPWGSGDGPTPAAKHSRVE